MVLTCSDFESTFIGTGSSVMLCTCFFEMHLFFFPEIKRMSVFKKYEPGEPTCRLYVKNIAKQVEEKVGAFIALDPLMCVWI